MDYLLFLGTFFLISVSPGINMILALSFGLNVGWKKSIFLILGQNVAIAILSLICGLGLGFLMIKFPNVFYVFKICGGIYILFLSFKIYRDSGKINLQKVRSNITKKELFSQGFLISFTNPKAGIFIGSLLPKFLGSSHTLSVSLGILIAIIVAVEFCCLNLYALGGAFMKKFVSGRANLINKISAFTIGFLGLIIIFE